MTLCTCVSVVLVLPVKEWKEFWASLNINGLSSKTQTVY